MTINFSFSRSVFKGLVLQTCKYQGLFGKGLKQMGGGPTVIERIEISRNEPVKILVACILNCSQNVVVYPTEYRPELFPKCCSLSQRIQT